MSSNNNLIDNQITMDLNLNKYQGYLFKKRKLMGYRKYFVVLYMGNIIYYKNGYTYKFDRIHIRKI